MLVLHISYIHEYLLFQLGATQLSKEYQRKRRISNMLGKLFVKLQIV